MNELISSVVFLILNNLVQDLSYMLLFYVCSTWSFHCLIYFMCVPVSRFDLRTLPVDFVECLMRFQPTENEIKILRQFEKERKPVESLTDEDRFMMQFSKIERLMQKMTIMAFIGNFCESIQMLTPVSFGQFALNCKTRKAVKDS